MATLRASFYTIGNLMTETELLTLHFLHFKNAREGQDERVAAQVEQAEKTLRALMDELAAIKLGLED
ncbi:hypothetical protein FACS189441_6870 [Betaproteobacteria bacterium]|nr:hypothetical protein FACS189441_6870 [Betaproteobacteria bacterium]